MENMKNSRRNFFKKGLAGAVALGTASLSQPVSAVTAKVNVPAAKRIVLISLDGICVDGFLKAKTPNLDKLMAEGSLSLDTRVVMPSVTLPNWTSHLCGSGPEQHGVVDNSWEISKFVLPAIEKDNAGYYPSVFKVLKEALPQAKTAFYYLPNAFLREYIAILMMNKKRHMIICGLLFAGSAFLSLITLLF